MIVDNADDAAVFFLYVNAGISLVQDYMGYSIVLSTYLPQKSRGLILIILRNRDFVFRLIGGIGRVLKMSHWRGMILETCYKKNCQTIN